MKPKMVLVSIVLLAVSTLGAAQTGSEYKDPDGKFKITLTGDWRAVTYSDAVGRQKTEFVYRDRSEGLLKISREALNGSLAETVRQEEENLKIYRPGFQRAASEAFGGGPLSGNRFSFFTTEGGRQLAHTYYYLQDKNSVWVLRF